MKKTQTLSGKHGLIHCSPCWALVRHYLCPEKSVCHHCNMVWCPTKEEGNNHKQNHSHGSLSLKPATEVEETPDGYSITGQHDGQRDKKTQGVTKNSGYQSPHVSAAGVIKFSTRYLTRILRNKGRTEKPWQRQKCSNTPDSSTNPPADQLSVSLARLHSSHNHHVTIHTDASKEENAGVEA